MREAKQLRFAVLDRLDPPQGLWEVAVERSQGELSFTATRRPRRLWWALLAAAAACAILAAAGVLGTRGGGASGGSASRSAARPPELARANLPYRPGGGVGVAASPPNVDVHAPQVNAVAAFGATAWLVGATNVDTGKASAWDWRDGRWISMRIPGARAQSTLYSVTSLGADDAWAVGSWTVTFHRSDHTVGERVYPLVEHWDGAGWTRVPVRLPGQGELRSVAAVSDSDVWAVGGATVGHPGTYREVPYAIHWDGRAWTRVRLPLTSDVTDVVTVSASGPRDVWVVAEHAGSRPFHSLLVRYDGSHWRRMPAPFGPRDIPRALVAHSPDDVWAVGSFSIGGCPMRAHSHSLAARWDGHRWQVAPSPTLGTDSEFGGLAIAPDGRPWAFGDDAHVSISSTTCRDTEHTRAAITTTAVSAVIERWVGDRWQVAGSLPIGSQWLLGAAAGRTAVWTLGRDQLRHPNAPIVLRFAHGHVVQTHVPR